MERWLKSYHKLKGALEVFSPTLTLEKGKKMIWRSCDFAVLKITYPTEPRKEPSSFLILVQRLYYFTDALPNCMVITHDFYLNGCLLGTH